MNAVQGFASDRDPAVAGAWHKFLNAATADGNRQGLMTVLKDYKKIDTIIRSKNWLRACCNR
jgi:hypothetical protein